jgi:hypothetical protein
MFIVICISVVCSRVGGRDHMIVGFTSTVAISNYHSESREIDIRTLKGNVYFIQHYVIKFISDLIFLKILVKVALNTLTLQILFNIQV